MEYIFETEHLRIRKFDLEDAPQLYRNHQESEARKWIPNECYGDLEEAKGAISFFAECVAQKRLPYVLAVELKENGVLIGDTGINEVDGKPEEVEVGYTICQEYQGRGYATELLAGMCDFVKSNFEFRTLYGRVMRGNDASIRVLQKNGFVFIREEFGAEDDPYGNGMLIYKKGAES